MWIDRTERTDGRSERHKCIEAVASPPYIVSLRRLQQAGSSEWNELWMDFVMEADGESEWTIEVFMGNGARVDSSS